MVLLGEEGSMKLMPPKTIAEKIEMAAEMSKYGIKAIGTLSKWVNEEN